jgi:hypothetical protein
VSGEAKCEASHVIDSESKRPCRRDGRAAEGARLESVFRGNSNVGSNPTLSASTSKESQKTEKYPIMSRLVLLVIFSDFS